MSNTHDPLDRLRLPRFPRTNAYDPAWIIANQMGPHPLWLLESLTERITLHPGMRVLDLGCGTALTSIFLAREFGVRVWAADLWIDPSSNWTRIHEAGVTDLVTPMRATAHELPFAREFFEAVVSIDAYHYFGTEDLFLAWSLAPLMAPGSPIGIVVPAVREEIDEVPEPLRPYWTADMWTLHSPQWWRRHFERSGEVEVQAADSLPDGWNLWRTWGEVLQEVGASHAPDAPPPPEGTDDLALLEADTGHLLGFATVIGRKRDVA